nr:hypothetical protein CFP56_33934 [Quercus suber]
MSPVEAESIMEEEGQNDRWTEKAVMELKAQQISEVEIDLEVNYSGSAKAPDRSLNGELNVGNNIKDPTLNAVTTNSLVEVIAITKALHFANDLGLPSIMLEGDSKITIDALASENSSLIEYGHLVDETRELAKGFYVF